jgi:YfiH family protein
MSVVDLQMITPDWPAPPGVRAAFTLRTGGVSVAPYDSLNLGARIGDSSEAVAENRRRVREKLRLPAEPVWLEQVHGTVVVQLGVAAARTRPLADVARAATNTGSGGAVDVTVHARAVADVALVGGAEGTASPPTGDAAVAWGAGHVCAIRVADCMPVLFAARDGSAVGAAHAGWRGLAAGVLEATIRRLAVPPSQLIAWMGPAIGSAHFEVGDEVRAAFTATDAGAASAFVANERGRWQCDLYALARRRLTAIAVSGIYGGGWCTFADSERFFSYRRNSQCGRMAALIWIESEQVEPQD